VTHALAFFIAGLICGCATVVTFVGFAAAAFHVLHCS